MKKSFKIISTILILSMIFILVVIVSLSFMSFITKKPVALFGYSYGVVETASMEPLIVPGDFVLIESMDPTTLKVGDVIAFKSVLGITIVHEIIYVHEVEGFITQGINNDVNDFEVEGYITHDEVIGKITHFGGHEIGSILIDSRLQIIGIIVIIVCIIFIIQSLHVIKLLMNRQKEKYASDLEKFKKELKENQEKLKNKI